MIEITITTITAYGSFASAEALHFSGIIAAVGAGMLCGHGARRGAMSAATRIAVTAFWEYVAFALNSIVFLLLGLQVNLPVLLGFWVPILAAYLVVTAGRALMSSLLSWLGLGQEHSGRPAND